MAWWPFGNKKKPDATAAMTPAAPDDDARTIPPQRDHAAEDDEPLTLPPPDGDPFAKTLADPNADEVDAGADGRTLLPVHAQDEAERAADALEEFSASPGGAWVPSDPFGGPA